MSVEINRNKNMNEDMMDVSTVLESETLKSKHLGESINYSIYLPKGYRYSNKKYPVVYLLHSARGDETSWIQYGQIKGILDKMIEAGTIGPMIVVMPAGSSKSTRNYGCLFIDDYQHKYQYENMFMKELIPHIDKVYRTRKTREFRALAGCATGGFASLYYAFKYPDSFSATAAISAALLNDEVLADLPDNFYDRNFGRHIGMGLRGKERANENFRKIDIMHQLKNGAYEGMDSLSIYLDCGDKDFKGMVTQTNSELHILLSRMNIRHEYRVRSGQHDWTYWREGIKHAMVHLSKQFLKS